ncbi:hypothetical protein [Streptomyces sp. NPDC051452]|uniref:hypothetical protein n=1 Tax=Streptomyces sp. NPDC051452 TaxID=3365654 RepID=UPI0037BD3F76
MSIAGIANTGGLSHAQFGGESMVDGIQNIVDNFKEKSGITEPEENDGEDGEQETRSTAFRPHAFGQSGAQRRTSWPSSSAYNSGSLTFADH